MTAWRQLLSWRGLSDILMAFDFDKGFFFELLLSAFNTIRNRVNCGSLYRTDVMLRGKKLSIEAVDIIGL